jgi:tight adherence protein B
MGLAIAVSLIVLALGGAAYAFAGGEGTNARIASAAGRGGAKDKIKAADPVSGRRKTVQAALKEIEQQKAERRKMTTRRRLDQAGHLNTTEKQFWLISAGLGAGAFALCFITGQTIFVDAMATFAAGLGLPRWVLGFLKRRREKKFTKDFANAIDVIVRSVKSGLPSHDALKVVASDFREPVRGEFSRLTESLRLGVTMEDALKRMYESMPTPEVAFFGIVMTIQSKSGGNLSEALSNLSSVLRDRKRLQGKIKAMSSEAKASAGIIGALPPGVMMLVYLTTPAYISVLFTERTGNLLLVGCGIWMGLGIAVMKKMVNFKH